MRCGLLIIGDEILSGKRQDQHFVHVRDLLKQRHLALAWVSILGDDRAMIAERLRSARESGTPVLSTGGIGGTPDDQTRQAAGEAWGRPLELHRVAADMIAQRTQAIGQPLTPERLRMGEFPQGAEIIPNPYNGIPGFSLGNQHFVPGFPEMAWPMLSWVLDQYYADACLQERVVERAVFVRGLAEATMTPLMEAVEREFAGVRIFSLPRLSTRQGTAHVEVGVKGPVDTIETAFAHLVEGIAKLGGDALRQREEPENRNPSNAD